MFGNVRGEVDGKKPPSTVYLQRRKDGPGFNVWVAGMSRLPTAEPWYLNAVPFNAHAAAPTCSGDVLCFDSVRFLLGDFDGDGRDDLMVIAPRNGGTAFWLLHSTGTRFEAPRLWYQTTSAFTPARAQQYVTGDFTGSGRADVMIAQKTQRRQPRSLGGRKCRHHRPRARALDEGKRTRRECALPAGSRSRIAAYRPDRDRKREFGDGRHAVRQFRRRVHRSLARQHLRGIRAGVRQGRGGRCGRPGYRRPGRAAATRRWS